MRLLKQILQKTSCDKLEYAYGEFNLYIGTQQFSEHEYAQLKGLFERATQWCVDNGIDEIVIRRVK